MSGPDAWLVVWDSDGVACRRAFVWKPDAQYWATLMADSEGCSGVAVHPLAVVKESLTAEAPHQENTP